MLSSALSDAMRHRRLPRNVAQHAILPPVRTAEREPWTAAHAVAFLDYALRTGDRLANLFEVIIGRTTPRRGTRTALVRPRSGARTLFVHPDRGTLSDVAGRLMLTAPKMKGSAAGVGLSTRVVAALQRQAVERDERGEPSATKDDDLVFAGVNGAPLRHATSGTTAGLYRNLTAEAALAAAAELANEHAELAATALRPHGHDPPLLSGSAGDVTAEQRWSRLGESNPGPAHYEGAGPRLLWLLHNSCRSHTYGCISGTVRPEFAPRLIPRRAGRAMPDSATGRRRLYGEHEADLSVGHLVVPAETPATPHLGECSVAQLVAARCCAIVGSMGQVVSMLERPVYSYAEIDRLLRLTPRYRQAVDRRLQASWAGLRARGPAGTYRFTVGDVGRVRRDAAAF